MKDITISKNNLNNIRSFLELIYYNNNATREEVDDFLRNCLQFMFEINGLDVKNYNITFHYPKSKTLTECEAKMVADDNKLEKFDVVFKYDVFKVKNKDDVKGYIYPLYIAFHEFAHILQYILKRDEMDTFDADLIGTQDSIDILSQSQHLTPEIKKVKKNMEKYLFNLDIISPYEKDANKNSFLTCRRLFDTLLVDETDDELADYYLENLNNLSFLRKDEFVFYRKFGKSQREVVERLKASNFVDFSM